MQRSTTMTPISHLLLNSYYSMLGKHPEREALITTSTGFM